MPTNQCERTDCAPDPAMTRSARHPVPAAPDADQALRARRVTCGLYPQPGARTGERATHHPIRECYLLTLYFCGSLLSHLRSRRFGLERCPQRICDLAIRALQRFVRDIALARCYR